MDDFDPITTWPALVRAYQKIRHESELALGAQGVSSLEEYDILLELRRAAMPLTLTELEGQTLLRQYQLSRMVERLVRKGYVDRSVAKNDARERKITLTREGREVQRRAGKAYLKILESRLVNRLEQVELQQMVRSLRQIAQG